MATIEVFPEQLSTGEKIDLKARLGKEGLGGAILLQNARWFMKVRWIIVALLLVFGLISNYLPAILKEIGIEPPEFWPILLAVILGVLNIIYHMTLNKITLNKKRDSSSERFVRTHIWCQIITDLVILTIIIYYTGSVSTYFPFMYLFHIAIACVFLPTKGSFIVTGLSVALYISLIILELSGILPYSSLFSNNVFLKTAFYKEGIAVVVIMALSAVVILVVVWYFISSLASAVRRRDAQLQIANEELIRANQEKTKQVLVTTHELKAPFSGIESNIQVIKYKFWDKLPQDIAEIITRIERRAAALRERISEILTLGELRSKEIEEGAIEEVDIKDVTRNVITNFQDRIREKKLQIDERVENFILKAVPEHIQILVSNLISNAVQYSFESGKISIYSRRDNNKYVFAVKDQGIGIREDALPHIFDEYYRTNEASRFNKNSTGLGLSMVKEIANKYGLIIKVESAEGEGTLFEIGFPAR